MNHFKGLFEFLGNWFCFHKWENIKTGERKTSFLGHPVIYDEHELRGCRKCGVVQQYHYDSQGGCWSPLDEQQMKIIKDKKMW
jgi:hypothetical protein